NSRTLQHAESLRALLKYIAKKVIEGNDQQLKEYTLAVEVFGRGGDFNATTDSLVRVQAKRLREKLEEYYRNEGSADEILIDLPKGHYSLIFSSVKRERSEATAADPSSFGGDAPTTAIDGHGGATVRSGEPVRVRLSLAASAALLMALLGATFFWLVTRSSRIKGPGDERSVKQSFSFSSLCWAPFLNSSLPTLLILSNPPVYRFTNAVDPPVLLKNSVQLTHAEVAWLDESLKDRYIARQKDTPRLVLAARDYTGIGEAIGLTRVFDLFRSSGKPVSFKQSRTVSAEDLKSNNAVLLGSVWSNVWSGKLPVKEDFTYSLNSTIVNHRPQAGESEEYWPEFNDQTGDLVKDYALITLRPGVIEDSMVMVLGGIKSEGTQAAAEFVTEKEYLALLNGRLAQVSHDGVPPKYYQVLLKVDVDNGIPTTISILAIHPLTVARQ
ncbi:MAG TPA: hypothetical protein VEZ90_18880, partial [Blastocatellia bacterium]|nr:hypothetical protein [Blastocatellia bacterium]